MRDCDRPIFVVVRHDWPQRVTIDGCTPPHVKPAGWRDLAM
jgi:hypothetical protein